VTEKAISALLDQGSHEAALIHGLDAYGGSLFGYLASRLSLDRAEDAYQDLCVELLKGISRFERRCSFRVWAFHLAHGVRCKVLRDPGGRRLRRLRTGDESSFPARAARTATQTWRRTESRQRLWEVCRTLPEQDQALLRLRVEERMAWLDIVLVLEGPPQEEEDLRRRAATLRKRFERIKEQIRDALN
jgi:RNA polymerase sigma factor (sigma-70 family)